MSISEIISFFNNNQWTLHLITITISSVTLIKVNKFIFNQSTKGNYSPNQTLGDNSEAYSAGGNIKK